jgi:hypothetical protein
MLGATVAMAVGPVARADELFEPIKIELTSPAPGVPDPLDPPVVVSPDPDLLTLPVPAEHPWMLFDADELPALRERILGAPADSVVGEAWAGLLATISAPAFTNRDSYLAGLQDPTSRRGGRDDQLLVAFAWHITGDDAYLDQAKTLLQYAVTLTPDYGAPIEPGVDEYYIQRAHRLNGFALAYDLLHDDLPPLELLQLRAIVEVLGRQHLLHANTAWWGLLSAGSNIGGNNAAALGTAALALWHDDPDARAWLLRAEQIVRGYFHEGFDPEGAGIEGILYGNYGMRIPTLLGHALGRAGHDGLLDAGGLPGHEPWFAYEVLPGGGAVNPLNDARYYEINPTFTTWQSTFGDQPELSRWLFDDFTRKVPGATRSVGELLPTLLWYEPSDPAFDPADVLPLAEDYAELGLVHVRSGWAADDLMASFLVRQSDWGEGVHQNHDVGQFTLYSRGAKLITDSRYGNWLAKTAAGDSAAAATSESQAHNLVVADGRSQDFFGKGDLVGFASTAEVGDPGAVDVAAADARLAWLVDQPQRADRYFLHVRAQPGTPDYLVVADRFTQGGGDHTYTSYLHTDWRNDATVDPVDPGSVRIESGEAPGVGLDVDIHAAAPISTRIGSFTPDDAQDWARLGEDGRKANDRVETTSTAPSYEALAVLAPTGVGRTSPPVRRVAGDGGIADVVDVGRRLTDTILLATGSATEVSAAGIRTDAPFLAVRRGPAGISYLAMAEGTFVEVDGVRVLEVTGGRATVAVDRDRVDVNAPADVTTPDAPGPAADAPSTGGRLPATGGGPAPTLRLLAVAAVLVAVERLRRPPVCPRVSGRRQGWR